MMRRRRLPRSNSLWDKTWGELGITWYTIVRDSETGCDWRYCEPYVHITKCLAGTNTCTYQDWAASTYDMWSQSWEYLPTSKAKYHLPSIKRSGRKDWGSSYISGFLASTLSDISKALSQLRNWWQETRKGIYHTFVMTREPLGIWYPRYWSF